MNMLVIVGQWQTKSNAEPWLTHTTLNFQILSTWSPFKFLFNLVPFRRNIQFWFRNFKSFYIGPRTSQCVQNLSFAKFNAKKFSFVFSFIFIFFIYFYIFSFSFYVFVFLFIYIINLRQDDHLNQKLINWWSKWWLPSKKNMWS